MNQPSNDPHEVFMEITSNKIDTQDKRLDAIEGKMKTLPEQLTLMQALGKQMEAVRGEIKATRFPTERVEECTRKINEGITVFGHLSKCSVEHHHYIPKVIWIAAGLFVAFSLVCTGWFYTYKKLNEQIANDTKYRQLKLDTANHHLQVYLGWLDSLYIANPNLRKTVLQVENEYRLNFERLERAKQLNAEAKELEKEAKKKKKK